MYKSPKLLCILLGLVLLPQFSFSQLETKETGYWRQVAPGMAGSNRAIYADKVDPNKLWVAPDMGNDYITYDAGKHWETTVPANSVWTKRNALSDECVMSDHKDNSVVISLKKKGIHYSTDGGLTFKKISSFASGKAPNSIWYTACPHPKEKGTWYIANGLDNKDLRFGTNPNPIKGIAKNQPKVWKVTDITKTSRTIEAIPAKGMDAETAVFDIFCHPNTKKYPEMLFAATSTGFYRKDGVLKNWKKLLEGTTKADYQYNGKSLTIYVLQQATYKLDGDQLISNGGVYKTTDPETISTSSEWNNKTQDLLIDLTQVDTKQHIYYWMIKKWFGYDKKKELDVKLPTKFFQNYTDILCDPTDANKVYLPVWGGHQNKPIIGSVWATSNGGNNWFAALRAGNGFEKDAYWTTKQPGKANQNVDLQIHKKKFPKNVRYGRRGVRSMAIAADGTAYASAVKGYATLKYNSEKDEWTSVDNTYSQGTYFGHGNADTGAFTVIPDIHHKGEMFVLQYELSAWKSSNTTDPDFPGIVGVTPIPALIDKGKSWAPGQPYNTPTTVACDPNDPTVFYAMSSRTGSFMKISENGTKMEVLSEPIEVEDILIVPKMQVVYWTDLRIASDGKTMYAVAEIIDNDNKPMGQTRIFNPNSQKGVYKSSDGGLTWKCLNKGIPKVAGGRKKNVVYGDDSAAVKSLTLDPNNENMLYASVRRYRAPEGETGWVNGGLFITQNGAKSWEKAEIPSDIKSVWDIWLNNTDKKAPTKIYISGGGNGSINEWGEGGVWEATYRLDGKYKASGWKKIFKQHPFVSHVRTSPFNPNLMLLVTRESWSNNKINAGTYYSTNGGKKWIKFNEGRGGMMVGDITFDSGTPNRVWAACESSGTYTALLPVK